MPALTTVMLALLRDIASFSERACGLQLREYQLRVARAVIDSIINDRGLTFVVIFPRQSGKNELQAHLEAYLLALYANCQAEIVKVSPTWKPQSLNAMRRLERVLSKNIILRHKFEREQGYIFRFLSARVFFLSGQPESNVVGATATHLLECDEAQDVTIAKWDKEFNPMAASKNATKVFWGTAWTSQTLLAREKRAALEAQEKDGLQRVFILTADDVRAEVPSYGRFVDAEIAKLGRQHPFVRTQYFSEEIDSESGMFPASRLALMQGTHPPLDSPPSGTDRRGGLTSAQPTLALSENPPSPIYAFLLDIAGQDESAASIHQDEVLMNKNRDSTALTIVEVDLSTLTDPLIARPRYRVVHRRLWTGIRHTTLYAQLTALIDLWQPQRVIIDATGVGAGLASFLSKSYPSLVIPFIFTSKSKSDLGWNFLSVIETGRYQEYHCQNPQGFDSDIQKTFFTQVEFCRSEIQPGPNKLMRWGVPDGTRDPANGDLVHDDLLISAALCAILDDQTWGLTQSAIIPSIDPLSDLPSY